MILTITCPSCERETDIEYVPAIPAKITSYPETSHPPVPATWEPQCCTCGCCFSEDTLFDEFERWSERWEDDYKYDYLHETYDDPDDDPDDDPTID